MTSKCLKNFDYSEGAFPKLVGGGTDEKLGGPTKKLEAKAGCLKNINTLKREYRIVLSMEPSFPLCMQNDTDLFSTRFSVPWLSKTLCLAETARPVSEPKCWILHQLLRYTCSC